MAGDPLTVKTPDINSIAGDKMVAFTPNTTGVPYGLNKEKKSLNSYSMWGICFLLLITSEFL